LADTSEANDNFNFSFRIVSEFESTATGGGVDGYLTTYSPNNYGPGGTVRLDLVTITGTPKPGANTPPTISTFSNQTVRINQSTAALSFTVGDAEDAASSLSLSGASSDPAVIPENNIVFGGSGGSRTVTVSAGSQTGSSLITVYVIDTGARSNSASFFV